MSREVAYGLNFTATDKMTPVLDKIEDSAAKADEALSDLADSAENVGDKAVPALEGVADAADQAKAAAESLGKAAGPALKGLEDQAKKTRKSKKDLGDTAGAAASKVGALKTETEKSTGALGSFTMSAGPYGAALAAITASAALAGLAVVKLGQSFAEYAAAAARVEALEIRTAAAIRVHTSLSDDEFETLKRGNDERERRLGIDADLQLQAQGTLASMGVQKQALDRATKATIGLSNATGQGLTEASRVVARALGGNVAALQEYGIKVSSVQEAQARFAQMFDVVVAKAGTYGTKVSSLSHAWDGLSEAFGKLIIQNPDVLRVLDSIIGGVVSLTKATEQGGEKAKGYQQIISTVFKGIGTMAQASAKLISNAIRALNLVVRSPNLMRLAKDLDQSVIEMQNIMSGGTGNEAQAAMDAAAESYVDAAKQLVYFENEANRIRNDLARGIPGAADEMLVVAGQINEAKNRMKELQEWAEKSTLGVRGLMQASEALASEGVRSPTAPAPRTGGGRARVISRVEEKPKDAAPGGESWEQFTARMRKANNLAREAAMIRGQYLAEQEQENQQRVLEIQAAYQEQQEKQRQSVFEATAEAARQYAEQMRSFLEGVGMQAVDIFGQAFSSIGRLQNETVTELVRNEEGMLEERTRITKQYVQTVESAMGQLLGDLAAMLGKAALHYIAVEAVKAMASAVLASIKTFGVLGLIVGAGVGAAAYGLVKATSGKMPQPPKFHTGGIVPGVPGRERMAIVQSGERVSSVADTVDGRGGGGNITINNNLLVAPSRVQVERTNRDVLMPSMRRLQRLGFAG